MTLVVENADFGRKTPLRDAFRGAISDTWFLGLFVKSFTQRELAQKWDFSKMGGFVHCLLTFWQKVIGKWPKVGVFGGKFGHPHF